MARQPEHLVDQQRRLGRYLAALREAAGLCQPDIARAVPCHRTTVTHAEAGSQLPASDFWETADRLVGANGALIARYDELIQAKAAHLAEQQAKRRARAQATAQELAMAPPPRSPESSQTVTQWNCHSITFAVRKITGEDLSVTRREAIVAGASAAPTGAMLTEPLQQWLFPINDDAKFSMHRSVFSSTELTSLEGLVEQFGCWSGNGNGVIARKAVIAQLKDVTDRLRGVSSGPSTWRAFGVAAKLSEVVASMSWDAGLHSSAQRYYVASVQLAKLANDDGLAATVLAALARQCYDLGHPRDGLEIVQLAQYGCRKTATALLRAMLTTREAWGYPNWETPERSIVPLALRRSIFLMARRTAIILLFKFLTPPSLWAQSVGATATWLDTSYDGLGRLKNILNRHLSCVARHKFDFAFSILLA